VASFAKVLAGEELSVELLDWFFRWKSKSTCYVQVTKLHQCVGSATVVTERICSFETNILIFTTLNSFITHKLHQQIHLSTFGRVLQHVSSVDYSHPQGVVIYIYMQLRLYFILVEINGKLHYKLLFSLALQPSAGYDLLVHEVS
jgi:hypothetical protein